MKILFIGDLIGKAGRRSVKKHLKRVQAEHEIDFTVANVENSAGGFGITVALVKELFSSSIERDGT